MNYPQYQDNVIDSINYQPLIRKGHDTNKGDFGHVGIIGGNDMMFGSLLLSGRAAMLSGSGKVSLGFLGSNYPPVDFLMPELMCGDYIYVLNSINKFDVLIIGPGFGVGQQSINILAQLMNMGFLGKLIIDADALNIISQHNVIQSQFILLNNKVITPHPKEASRLLGISVKEVQQDRVNCAIRLSKKYNSIVLLKGYGSIITDSYNTYVNKTGGSALSNAGQGDLLCGIIASFIAQGMSILDATRFATYIHGRSSDDLVNSYGGNLGLIATDTSMNIRNILNQILTIC